MKIFLILFIVFITLLGNQPVQANQKPVPIVKNGSCPGGYMTSGSYCVPMKSVKRPAIPKVGSCPSDYVASGKYCK